MPDRETPPIRRDRDWWSGRTRPVDLLLGRGPLDQREKVVDSEGVRPVYRRIFRRLREAGCDWVYHFPRLCLLRFDKVKENMRPPQRTEAYDG